MSDEIDLIKILCSSYLILILKAKSLTLYITAVHNIFKLFTFLYTLLINQAHYDIFNLNSLAVFNMD